jgi:hypothetical protein
VEVEHQSREQTRQNGGGQGGEKEAPLKLRVVVLGGRGCDH